MLNRISRRPSANYAGRDIWLFQIEGERMSAAVTNFGGILQSLFVRDARGETLDVVLGYDTLAEYIADGTFFGAMIGPIADRMDGGRCVLAGKQVELPKNAGPDSMHSGPRGFHRQIWDWEELPDGISFSRRFSDGELGFPGSLGVRLNYRLNGDALRLEYAARSDTETALSFTNHSYFNLDGARGDCRSHVLKLSASQYAETRRQTDPIATGRLLDAAGTPLDFRSGRAVGDAAARAEFPEIRAAGGVDHYFACDGEGFRTMATLASPASGLTLTCSSDAPGLLVYTGNGLDGVAGKGGKIYGRHWGVCLETGRFPNAVNFPGRREGVLLQPGEAYESATEFAFSAE